RHSHNNHWHGGSETAPAVPAWPSRVQNGFSDAPAPLPSCRRSMQFLPRPGLRKSSACRSCFCCVSSLHPLFILAFDPSRYPSAHARMEIHKCGMPPLIHLKSDFQVTSRTDIAVIVPCHQTGITAQSGPLLGKYPLNHYVVRHI